MYYLGLYEKSGVLAREFVAQGYKAMCVDLDAEPGERDGVTYVQADMMDFIPPRHVIQEGVAFVAAFPPCDHLAVSGARWFAGKGLGALAQSVELFGKAAFWAEYFDAPYMIENPVSTISTYWRKPDHIFHPWQFSGLNADDCYTKKTCLWTGNGFVMPELDTRQTSYPTTAYTRQLRDQIAPVFALAHHKAFLLPSLPQIVVDTTERMH